MVSVSSCIVRSIPPGGMLRDMEPNHFPPAASADQVAELDKKLADMAVKLDEVVQLVRQAAPLLNSPAVKLMNNTSLFRVGGRRG